MGGILDEKSMDEKIRNAFQSIGAEARYPFFDLEYKAITVKCQDVPCRHEDATMIDWSAAQQVTQMLNSGWRMERHIVCPPYVMFIFHRVKETEENEREQ